MIRILLWAALIFIFIPVAHADWTTVGVAYQCNHSVKTFSIVGTMDTSSPDDAGTIRPPPGYMVAKEGSTSIRCAIGKTNIRLKLSLFGPQLRGMCDGIGGANIQSMTINGKVVLGPELFASGCFFDPVLYDVRVNQEPGGAVSIRTCSGQWDWGKGYYGGKCDDVHVSP